MNCLKTSLIALLSILCAQTATVHATPVTKKVISESPAAKVVFRVVSATDGEAAWYEIQKVEVATQRTEVLVQDQQLFTNKQNDGGASVPAENKHVLALGYADQIINAAGGVPAFTKSLERYPQYGVPLPTGLLRQALIERGVIFPSTAP
jgi:hypothetical protein